MKEKQQLNKIEYKDNQIIINKCPTQKYGICLECMEKARPK